MMLTSAKATKEVMKVQRVKKVKNRRAYTALQAQGRAKEVRVKGVRKKEKRMDQWLRSKKEMARVDMGEHGKNMSNGECMQIAIFTLFQKHHHLETGRKVRIVLRKRRGTPKSRRQEGQKRLNQCSIQAGQRMS